MKTIRIIINKKGQQRTEADGMVGTECDKLLKPFEDAAGGQVLEREDKPEYYVDTETQQKVGQ